MPQVIVNPQSGLAEAVEDPSLVQQKLAQGYELPLHDAQGNKFSAPYEEAQNAVSSGGYRQPNPEELNNWMTQSHFQQPTEQAKTFIEGAARGIAGPLAPAMEQMMGVNPAHILARKTLNPGTALAGELTSLGIATAATGGLFGEAAASLAGASLPGIIGKAGEAASAGIEATGAFGNLARAMTTGAIESASYEAQNQMSEALIGNPHIFSEHVLADVGLSALIGGALGGATQLGMGPFSKLAKFSDKASELAEEFTPETKLVFNNKFGVPKDAPLFTKVVKEGAPGPNLIDALKEGATDLDKHAFISLFRNPMKFTADKISTLAAKITGPQIAKMFPEQAQKAASVLESFRMGVNTLSKIENQSAGLFGYGAFETIKPKLSSDEMNELYDRVNEIQSDPNILLDKLSKKTLPMAEHLPNTTTSLAKNVSDAVNYLSQKRPDLSKKAPLDSEKEANAVQISQFNKAAHIMETPLSLFQNIKNGTITHGHIEAMNIVYPHLLQSMQKEVMGNLIKYQSENKTPLDYKMRLGLSKLLGQNLDSGLNNLGKNQLVFASLGGMQMPQGGKPQTRPSKSGMGKMNIATQDQTRAQQSLQRTGR